MKASELMIGDLVEYYSKYKHGVGKIAGIEPREGSAEPTTFNVKPIPLTPEILEKNGFEKSRCENEWRFRYENNKDVVTIYWSNNPLHKCSVWASHNGTNNSPSKLHILFECLEVHQLQHALKLCGIEKTIEL